MTNDKQIPFFSPSGLCWRTEINMRADTVGTSPHSTIARLSEELSRQRNRAALETIAIAAAIKARGNT